MKYETIKDWRDALVRIAVEKLPDCTIKMPDSRDNDRIEIYLPEQVQNDWAFVHVDLSPAGKTKRDRIRVWERWSKHRDYETEDQFSRNIAKLVAQWKAEKATAKIEQEARIAKEKAEQKRARMLEWLAVKEIKKAFVRHRLERCKAEGNHNSGTVYIDFPKIKDPTGYAWGRSLELNYVANDNNLLAWSIGKYYGAIIRDLAAFAKTIY
jgi:hypothetical protein